MWPVIAVLVFCGLMAAGGFWVIVGLPRFEARQMLRHDPGRVVFETVIELLRSRSADWEYTQGGHHLPGANIAVLVYPLFAVAVAGTDGRARKIRPSDAWAKKIRVAYDQMQSEQLRAATLHTICDAVEGLAANNVIPMRREGSNG
jgi:hypothetical protein